MTLSLSFMEKNKIGVIGGGAAGFFAAIQAKENFPSATVVLLEKTKNLLSKVKISGGGRCNVTNATTSIGELKKAYPRGGKQLKKILPQFSTNDIQSWFEERGVPLYTQEDQRVFPVSDDSQTIIDCLVNETNRLGIEIKTEVNIQTISKNDGVFELTTNTDNFFQFDTVIVATGGSPKRKGLEWLVKMGHTIEDPVPSLFSFNMPNEEVKTLMGLAVEKATTTIEGEKWFASEPLLITHWGMSGPAVLVLSSFGARALAQKNYQFNLLVNWINENNQGKVQEELLAFTQENGDKLLKNGRPYQIPSRLWVFLLRKTGLDPEKRWGDIGKKGVNKLLNILTNDNYKVEGKTTFKEEFVTCGGVSLNDINIKTMESKVVPQLYFAGEVLDIDAVTGGFNFQAAWTTGYIAGKLGEV